MPFDIGGLESGKSADATRRLGRIKHDDDNDDEESTLTTTSTTTTIMDRQAPCD